MDSDPLKAFQHIVEIIPQRVHHVLQEIVFAHVCTSSHILGRLSVPSINPSILERSGSEFLDPLKYFQVVCFVQIKAATSFLFALQKCVKVQGPKLTFLLMGYEGSAANSAKSVCCSNV